MLREQLRPAYRAEYGLTLRATDWAPRRDGGTSRLTANQIRGLLVAGGRRPGDGAPAAAGRDRRGLHAGDLPGADAPGREAAPLRAERVIDVSLVAYRTQQTTGIIARWFDDLIGDADVRHDHRGYGDPR